MKNTHLRKIFSFSFYAASCFVLAAFLFQTAPMSAQTTTTNAATSADVAALQAQISALDVKVTKIEEQNAQLMEKMDKVLSVFAVGKAMADKAASGASAVKSSWIDNSNLTDTQKQAFKEYFDGGTTPAETVTPSAINSTFKTGDSGKEVLLIQKVLNSDPDTKIAETGPGSSGNETTYFGELTTAAVVKFQEKYASQTLTPQGLSKGTGVIDANTQTMMNQIISQKGIKI